MASEHSFPTNDLRSAAVDYQRDYAQKHKWAGGEAAFASGGRQPISEGLRRPVHPQQKINAAIRRESGKDLRQVQHRANMARKHEILDEQSVTDSSDDDVVEASAAPEPDADITYSYDAPRGPGKGSQILTLALAKAVEKFEVKETEKLVKEEYEIVGREAEAGEGRADSGAAATDEDGFELV